MDYSKLIGRKKYRVQRSPSEVFETIEKLLCADEIVPDCKQWQVVGRSNGRIISFHKDLMWNFLVRESSVSFKPKELEMLTQQFNEDFNKHCDEELEMLRDNQPFELRVLVSDVNDLGCVCNAECRPALYWKLSKEITTMDALSDFTIWDACSESLSFLDELFVGVLEAKPIQEFSVKRSEMQLVVNDAQRREITDLIDSLLNKATGEILICGWIGTHFIPKLKELADEGVKVRFITHQPSEARNQPWRGEINQAFEKLCSFIGKENICTNPNMHGRIVIIDNKALIGSMDLNAYSLTGAHTEFAIYTEHPEIVRRLRNIFNSKFSPVKAS